MALNETAVQEDVPRPKADTTQVTFRIPKDWLDQADAIATVLAAERRITSSRTDVFREALARGFEALAREAGNRDETRYKIAASDGKMGTCLFWFGPDLDSAKRKADELARQHAASKWAVFRVFRADEKEPVYRALVVPKKR